MSPDGDLGFAPGDADFGMMVYSLSQLSRGVGEIECLLEVAEFEGLLQVVFIDDPPIIAKLFTDSVQFIPHKRCCIFARRFEFFTGKFIHGQLRLNMTYIVYILPRRKSTAWELFRLANGFDNVGSQIVAVERRHEVNTLNDRGKLIEQFDRDAYPFLRGLIACGIDLVAD